MVLRHIEFSVNAGEFVAIVGESGSGKSTLLQILGTVEKPDTGEVWFDKVSLFTLSAREQARRRNRKLGFVYQNHHLIPKLTALENVMLPLQIRGEDCAASMRSQAEELLSAFKLCKRLQHITD